MYRASGSPGLMLCAPLAERMATGEYAVPPPKVYRPFGGETERAGIAIGTDFEAGFEGVLAAGKGDGLARLKQIGPISDDISGGGVEGLIEAVGEIDAGLGLILGAEDRGRCARSRAWIREPDCGERVRV